MTTARAFTPSLLLVAALLACGPIPTGQQTPGGGNCSTLTLTAQDVVTAAPSRISLFFSVDGCGGDPVPGLSADAFELFEDDKPISSFESQKTIQPKGQRFRMYSLVLLDLSGSILKSGNFPALAEAAKLYVDEVLKSQGDGQRVAVYAFDGRPTLTPVVDFSSDAAVLKAGIDRLSTRECNVNADCVGFADRRACAGWLCVDDSTNLNGAVVAGVDRLERELRAEPGIPFKDSALIVFTDGTDQAARVSRDDALAKVRSGQPHVFAIGPGRRGGRERDARPGTGRLRARGPREPAQRSLRRHRQPHRRPGEPLLSAGVLLSEAERHPPADGAGEGGRRGSGADRDAHPFV